MHQPLIPVSECCGEPFARETIYHLTLKAICPKCAQPCLIDYALDEDSRHDTAQEDYGH